jgi:hypothetical protein
MVRTEELDFSLEGTSYTYLFILEMSKNLANPSCLIVFSCTNIHIADMNLCSPSFCLSGFVYQLYVQPILQMCNQLTIISNTSVKGRF